MGQSACYVSQGMFVIADTTLAGSLFCRLRPGPCRQPSSVLGLPPIPPVPARRPQTGDAKVRTGVRRRSGRVTGAGVEASKARNTGVCLRAGWRLRRPAAGAPSASAARRLRRTRPNAERRRPTPARTRTGLRAFCRGYPSGRRIPGGGGFATARGRPDIHLPIPRSGPDPARRGCDVAAYPTNRPAGPCRQKHAVHPQIDTKCRTINPGLTHLNMRPTPLKSNIFAETATCGRVKPLTGGFCGKQDASAPPSRLTLF